MQKHAESERYYGVRMSTLEDPNTHGTGQTSLRLSLARITSSPLSPKHLVHSQARRTSRTDTAFSASHPSHSSPSSEQSQHLLLRGPSYQTQTHKCSRDTTTVRKITPPCYSIHPLYRNPSLSRAHAHSPSAPGHFNQTQVIYSSAVVSASALRAGPICP